MRPFQYLAPTSISEAISLLAMHKEEARVIVGGTDLVVQMRRRVAMPRYVVDISGIPGLDYIRDDAARGLAIGAMTTIRSLEMSTDLRQRYPILAQAAGKLGGVISEADEEGVYLSFAPVLDELIPKKFFMTS